MSNYSCHFVILSTSSCGGIYKKIVGTLAIMLESPNLLGKNDTAACKNVAVLC